MKKNAKKKLVVYGAGAIGRGYLPWVFDPEVYDYFYVENNVRLATRLREHRQFTTHKTDGGRYFSKIVGIAECFESGQEAEVLGKGRHRCRPSEHAPARRTIEAGACTNHLLRE